MEYIKQLQEENKRLKQLIEIERRDYDKWFNNYHKSIYNIFQVLEEVVNLLHLPNAKNGEMAICTKVSNKNPILKVLREMNEEFGEQDYFEEVK